ncbi:Zinc finger, CCHC retroviral-type [Metarhizium brunneum]
MSSNKQMSKGVEDGVVEQPGGSRRVRSLNDERSSFVATTTTRDLSGAMEDIARRSEAHDDDDWVIYANNASRMLTGGLLPPPPAPPRDLLGIPASPRTPASVQRGAFRGQARDARGSQTPRSGQGRRGQDRRGWQVQGQNSRGQDRRGQSRGPSRGGIQKSRRQGTSSSARSLGARLGQDPSIIQDANKWRQQEVSRGRDTARAAQEKAQNELFCGNCLKHGHRVRDCVHPAEDGFVHGCPVCNKADHESAKDCKQTWPQRLERKLGWAIEHRANRPTLAAFPNWAKLFMEASEKGDITLPSKFPWTPFFAQELMERETQPWTDFDYVANDSSKLPLDPMTAGQETVIEHAESLFQIPLQVIGSTGGDPWYPRREEDEDMADPRPFHRPASDKLDERMDEDLS